PSSSSRRSPPSSGTRPMISDKRPGAREDSGPPAANNSRRRTPADPALVCFIDNADVAQLVEHNLAKVGVAGSNPVVRSDRRPGEGPYAGPSTIADATESAPPS